MCWPLWMQIIPSSSRLENPSEVKSHAFTRLSIPLKHLSKHLPSSFLKHFLYGRHISTRQERKSKRRSKLSGIKLSKVNTSCANTDWQLSFRAGPSKQKLCHFLSTLKKGCHFGYFKEAILQKSELQYYKITKNQIRKILKTEFCVLYTTSQKAYWLCKADTG